MHIAISAGEVSGDLLAADLIRHLKSRWPQAVFYGIAGPAMRAAGCESLIPMEKLSVMGFVDVLKRLPELLRLRRQFARQIAHMKPDLFIGIDAPDFNLAVAKKLKAKGIKTVHYVSPTVWAWRKGRVKSIKKSIDLMLTLFPFESSFYRKHAVNCCFVGHPMADQIPLESAPARSSVVISSQKNRVLALLPGSRMMEINALCEIFLKVAAHCLRDEFVSKIIIAAANEKTAREIQRIATTLGMIDKISILTGCARKVIAGADLVLVTSGTATLETMLLKKPMVVAYKMSWLNWLIARSLVSIPAFALPNLLAQRQIVPELLQDDVSVESLYQALIDISAKERSKELMLAYHGIHHELKKNASDMAARRIAQLMS